MIGAVETWEVHFWRRTSDAIKAQPTPRTIPTEPTMARILALITAVTFATIIAGCSCRSEAGGCKSCKSCEKPSAGAPASAPPAAK
jgi:hypothetical protein